MGYNAEQLLSVINDCDKSKEIIVEVGGTRIKLQHVYVVTQEMIDEEGLNQNELGTLVIDLDI